MCSSAGPGGSQQIEIPPSLNSKRPPAFPAPPVFRWVWRFQRPQGFCHPPDFWQPQGFCHPPDFRQPQGFCHPPDFRQPQGFYQPPDFQQPQGFYHSTDFLKPQGFSNPPDFYWPQVFEHFSSNSFFFFVYFFGGLECVGHSFAYVDCYLRPLVFPPHPRTYYCRP